MHLICGHWEVKWPYKGIHCRVKRGKEKEESLFEQKKTGECQRSFVIPSFPPC